MSFGREHNDDDDDSEDIRTIQSSATPLTFMNTSVVAEMDDNASGTIESSVSNTSYVLPTLYSNVGGGQQHPNLPGSPLSPIRPESPPMDYSAASPEIQRDVALLLKQQQQHQAHAISPSLLFHNSSPGSPGLLTSIATPKQSNSTPEKQLAYDVNATKILLSIPQFRLPAKEEGDNHRHHDDDNDSQLYSVASSKLNPDTITTGSTLELSLKTYREQQVLVEPLPVDRTGPSNNGTFAVASINTINPISLLLPPPPPSVKNDENVQNQRPGSASSATVASKDDASRDASKASSGKKSSTSKSITSSASSSSGQRKKKASFESSHPIVTAIIQEEQNKDGDESNGVSASSVDVEVGSERLNPLEYSNPFTTGVIGQTLRSVDSLNDRSYDSDMDDDVSSAAAKESKAIYPDSVTSSRQANDGSTTRQRQIISPLPPENTLSLLSNDRASDISNDRKLPPTNIIDEKQVIVPKFRLPPTTVVNPNSNKDAMTQLSSLESTNDSKIKFEEPRERLGGAYESHPTSSSNRESMSQMRFYRASTTNNVVVDLDDEPSLGKSSLGMSRGKSTIKSSKGNQTSMGSGDSFDFTLHVVDDFENTIDEAVQRGAAFAISAEPSIMEEGTSNTIKDFDRHEAVGGNISGITGHGERRVSNVDSKLKKAEKLPPGDAAKKLLASKMKRKQKRRMQICFYVVVCVLILLIVAVIAVGVVCGTVTECSIPGSGSNNSAKRNQAVPSPVPPTNAPRWSP
jgi:hypothetical protein